MGQVQDRLQLFFPPQAQAWTRDEDEKHCPSVRRNGLRWNPSVLEPLVAFYIWTLFLLYAVKYNLKSEKSKFNAKWVKTTTLTQYDVQDDHLLFISNKDNMVTTKTELSWSETKAALLQFNPECRLMKLLLKSIRNLMKKKKKTNRSNGFVRI